MEFCLLKDAERYYNNVIRDKPTKDGRYGPFWPLYSYELSDQDKPY
jgi:hypothetical protein